MRKVLVGLLMSGICLPSFGGQANSALLNMGGQVGDTYYVYQAAPRGIPLNKHMQVQEELLNHFRQEAKNREAELAAKTKLTVQQKRELADLRAQLASVEQEKRNLQAGYESEILKLKLANQKTQLASIERERRDLQAKHESLQFELDIKKALIAANNAAPTQKTDGVTIAPAMEREMFTLMERSEADRAGLSQSLAQAPDRLEPILKSLIAKTESMDDKEKAYWYALLPKMESKHRIRLFDILSTERRKLAELEFKYQDEIAKLNTKHLGEWIEFQRKHLDKNDSAAIRAFAAALIDSGQAKYLAEAESLLLKLLHSHADDAESRYQLGRLYAAREQWQDAQDAVAAAIRLAPDKSDYHGLSGKIYLREEKQDKALEAYARAFQLETRDTSLLRNYGALLLDLKRYKEAESVLRRYLYLAPKNADAYRLLGVALRDQDRFADAEDYLKQAVERDGKNSRNHIALAWAYYQRRQYVEAENAFQVAANLNTKDVDAATMVGLSMVEQGRRKEALQTLQAALKQAISHKASKADEAEIRLGIALLLSDNGKTDEGKALMADAAANSQNCSISYMKSRRNWHDQILRLLGEWRGSLCGG